MGVKPQAEAPHSAPVAPRGALRRRLRRRTCTARARAQRHRSVLQARAGPTWEYERSSSVARGLQGARRRGRAGRWQTERFSGAALPSNAPGAGRSKAEARAHAPAAGAQTTKNRPLCMATESIFFEPTRNLRRPYDLLCERRSMPRCERFSGSGHTSPPLRPPFPTPLATGVFGCACLDTCVVSTN